MWLRQRSIFNIFQKTIRRRAGRSFGKITVRHRGGGFNCKSTSIDYSRFLWNSPAVVRSLEYHKGVRSYVAAIVYTCGVASYILAPQGLRPGHTVMAGPLSVPSLGSSLLLKDIPFNLKIHNIESFLRSGGKYARAAGAWARVVERGQNSATIVFKNGKRKQLSSFCSATIGKTSNIFYRKRRVMSKAGANRLRGVRPSVRGVVQNPTDHPHGGGKGKKSPKNPNYNFIRKLPKGRKTARKK